jgi:hypothetical protein
MATQYRVTWFFEGVQSATYGASAALGWTETWGFTQPSNNIDDVFKALDILNYTQVRQNILTSQYRMTFIRVTQIASAGNIATRKVKVQTLNNKVGTIPVPPQTSAQVQCAILADLQRLPTAPQDKVHHRKFLLRGLPGNVINGNVLDPSGGSWVSVQLFFDFVAQHSVGDVHHGKINATGLGVVYQDVVNFPKFSMPGLVVDPVLYPNLIQLNQTLPGGVPGTQWRISNLHRPQSSFLNRAWTLIFQNVGPPLTVTLGKSRVPMLAQTIAFPNEGLIQNMVPIVGPFDQYAIIGLRSKRTGKLFHQLRGRSSNRVRP